MNPQKKSNHMHYQLLPLLVVLAGAILQWLLIDVNGIVFHTGFLLFALTGIGLAIFFGAELSTTERWQRIFLFGYILIVVFAHFVFHVKVIPFLLISIFMHEVFIRRKYKPRLNATDHE